jgi:signal transduction histidine kinase
MKPLLSETQDSSKLQDLGRASVQIVHDLKNQLNGLKLYATFLRRRLEAAQRPTDELETIAKLISGLERAAQDLSTIVLYGRPLTLKKRQGVNILALFREVCARLDAEQGSDGTLSEAICFEAEKTAWCGEYDPTLLAEAFKFISLGAIKMSQYRTDPQPMRICFSQSTEPAPSVTIEWSNVNQSVEDAFSSFVGSHGVGMSLAARIIEAHGGAAESRGTNLVVTLPLSV